MHVQIRFGILTSIVQNLLVFLATLLAFEKVESISMIFQCLPPDDSVNTVSWSPNGENVLIATSSGLYLYKSVTEFTSPQIIENVVVPVNEVSFSPDGTIFAVASLADSSVYIYETETLSLIETLKTPYDGLTRLAFDSSGNLLAAVSVRLDPDTGFPYDYLIRIWDIPSKVNVTDVSDVGLSIDSIGFTPDAKYLLIDASYPGYGKSEVRFWNLNDKVVDSLISERVVIGDIAPNGSMLSLITKDLMDNDEIKIVDTSNMNTVFETIAETNISTSSFDSQANFIAVGDTTGNIMIYNILAGTLEDIVETDFDDIKEIIFVPNGESLVILGSKDAQETIYLINLTDDTSIPLIQSCSL